MTLVATSTRGTPCVLYGAVMTASKGARQGVENLWISRKGERTKLYGKGMQWRARYVDSSGQEHTKRFRLKSEANQWLKEVTRGGLDIAPPVTGAWTVEQQYNEWIRRAHIAETTRSTRVHTWRRHVAPRWGEMVVTKIDPPGVKAWVADLKDGDAGVPTIENALGVLRMVLEDAVSDKRLIRNPCDGVKAPKRGPSKKRRRECYLSHEQVEQLACAVGADGTAVRFLAYTGLRWSEFAALSVGAIDLKRRRLDVDRKVAEASGKLTWGAPKDYERRSVPFPAFLVDELRERMVGKAPSDLVFTAPEGGVLRHSTWRPRTFAKARDSIDGFPKITPHDLRHTCASLVVSAGGNVLALARMLGHEDASMTLNTYADLFDTDLDALADVLGTSRKKALKDR